MTGNKYEDTKGRTVTVKNVENNIAILNNGERVAVERLNDGNFYKPLNVGGGNTTTAVMEQQVVNESATNNNAPTNRYEALIKNFQKNGQSGNLGITDDVDTRFDPRNGIQGDNPITSINDSGVVESHSHNLRSMGVQEDPGQSVPVMKPYVPPQQQKKQIEGPVSSNPDDLYGDVNHYNNKNASPEDALLEKYKHIGEGPKKSDALSRLAYGEDYDKAMLEDKKNGGSNTHPQRAERQPRQNTQPRADRDTSLAPRRREHIIEEDNGVNPVHQMFDKAKKTKTINVSLKINEKIPNKNVIKMLEENFDESAVDYYTNQIYLKLMENPKIIEDQVRETINKYVNGNPRK